MTPEEWQTNNNTMNERHSREEAAMARSRERAIFPSFDVLRDAKASDIKEGAIIYRKNERGNYWHEIHEVMHPDDDFKAYVADDGCRYGLHNAFVRKDK